MNIQCIHRPACPGCDLFEVPYQEQLARKTARVRDALDVWAPLRELPVEPCLGAAQRTGWRTRSKWAVDGARIGLFGPGHIVVDTPECVVAGPAALAVAERLRVRPPERGARLVALDVRVSRTGDAVPVLVVEARDAEIAWEHAVKLGEWLGEVPGARVTGVAASWRRPGAPTTLGGMPRAVWGETTIEDCVGHKPLLFPAGSFSQTHAQQTETLQDLVAKSVSELDGAERADLVDLYAGTGGIGLSLARRVRRVTLVETNGPAMDAARVSAERLAVGDRVRALAMPAEKALPELDPERPLILVVDPPRAGLSMPVLTALVRLRPELLVVVSCDPRTMARDLALLHPFGFAPGTARPLDLQPGTSQVECVVAVRPCEPPTPRTVAGGPGWAVMEKPPLMPTIPHPEWPTSLVALARRALPRAHAVHRLDGGTSGLVLVAEPGARAPDLEQSRKTYIALAKGITHKAGALRQELFDDGRPVEAETRYRRVDVVGGHSLLEVELFTGRTHQIRRHLAGVGHPVLGDARYGDPASNRHLDARHGLVRPFLHAARLETPDGTFESALWPDLQAALDSLRATGSRPSGKRPPAKKKRRPR